MGRLKNIFFPAFCNLIFRVSDNVKPRRSDLNSNQKPEKNRKWHMTVRESAATTTTVQLLGEVANHVWTHNEVGSLLNVTLECEVNKNGRKSRLTPLVLSVVEE